MLIHDLCTEAELYCRDAVGLIIVGDMNVHQTSWLTYSWRDTIEGRFLMDTCAVLGLKECVRAPTREGHLLDLVSSDLHAQLTTRVLPSVADHSAIEVTVSMPIAIHETSAREVWLYHKADWKSLHAAFMDIDWESIMGDDADGAAARLTHFIIQKAEQYIPRKTVMEATASFPWLTEAARHALTLRSGTGCLHGHAAL